MGPPAMRLAACDTPEAGAVGLAGILGFSVKIPLMETKADNK